MKRDMDLCRAILRFMEESNNMTETSKAIATAMGREPDDKESFYQCLIMAEAGYMKQFESSGVQKMPNLNYRSPPDPPEKMTVEISVPKEFWFRLTWSGQEFLAAAGDEARWAEAKSIAGKAKNWTFSTLSQVLTALAAQSWQQQISG